MNPSGPLLLGVDGGGTSTDAWLGAPGRIVLGRGRSGPSNAKAVGLDRAREALAHAIASAFEDAVLVPTPAAQACFGLAGFDRPDDRILLERWVSEHRWATRAMYVNDGDLVVAAGTPEGWGVGVIAGTGSIAVGRAPDGRTTRVGGWGHLIGDEGSAYAVALDALRLVARRADGRATAPDPDPLTTQLCAALGIASPRFIPSALYAPGVDRTRIASLAPVVLAAASVESGLVAELLGPAGAALGEQALTVARRLDFPVAPSVLPLALAGGFLLSAAPVSEALANALTRAGYSVAPCLVPAPVLGALLLAERALS
jgi:N-acetylglucosamine kinase-like BadF-type ATPase